MKLRSWSVWISEEHWDTNLDQHLHLITNADWAPRRCSCLEGARYPHPNRQEMP